MEDLSLENGTNTRQGHMQVGLTRLCGIPLPTRMASYGPRTVDKCFERLEKTIASWVPNSLHQLRGAAGYEDGANGMEAMQIF